jgi:predicted nucleotidyltransferase
MKFGSLGKMLPQKENLPMTRDLIETLRDYFQQEANRLKIKAVFLFGSQAGGLPRLDSDVDLAIAFVDEEMSNEETFDRMNVLAIGLTEILGREVNLISIDKDFSKPMLYYNAVVKGIPIFTADPHYYTWLLNEAIYQMEDFEIFGRDWQIDLAKRNLREIQNG